MTTQPSKSLPALLHPFTSVPVQVEGAPIVLVSGRGTWVRDREGRELLDGFAGLWCVNLGYGREELVQAATEQLRRLPYATLFFSFASEPALELADRLLAIAPPGLGHVFFTNGGSESVDSALKLIRQYHHLAGEPQRRHFISLQRGYHGVSYTGTSLTGIAACHQFFDAPAPSFHHLPSHYSYRSSYGKTDEEIIRGSVRALEDKVGELGAKNVAAFVCEPVQGSGGIIVPPRGWLKAMREACRRLDILFVADEVITGFCRTGRMFGCEHEAIDPDVMTLAKGITSGYVPMGAVLLSKRIGNVLATAAPKERIFANGFTFAGHPVAAAVSLAAIKLYEQERIAAASESLGQRLLSRLTSSLQNLPYVGEVRGQGLLVAVELVRNRETREKFDLALKLSQHVRKRCFEQGLIVRAFNDDIIGLAPALTATPEEIDMMADRLRNALAIAVEKDLPRQ